MKLDQQLRFEEHAAYIQLKMIGKINNLLGRIQGTIKQSTTEMLYETLILPIPDYGDIVYNCLSQKYTIILQRQQHMCLKNILQAGKHTSTVEIHTILDMPRFFKDGGTRVNVVRAVGYKLLANDARHEEGSS